MQTKKNSRKVGGSSGNRVYGFGGLEPGTPEPESNYINPSSIPPPLHQKAYNINKIRNLGVIIPPPHSSGNPLTRFKVNQGSRRSLSHVKPVNPKQTSISRDNRSRIPVKEHQMIPENSLISKHRSNLIIPAVGGSRKRRVKKKVRRTRKNKKKLSRK